MEIGVRPFAAGDAERVQQLVLKIQREEFGVPITQEEQPDLRYVPAHYQRERGGFWVATDHALIVGTVGRRRIAARTLVPERRC